MRVRPATVADVPAMVAILDASNEPIGWPDVPGWPYLEHLVDRASTAVAIGRDGTVVGFGGAIEAGQAGGRSLRWLTDLFVHPERREAGAGGAILDHLLDGASDRMTASTGDRRALSLYIRSGMRPWWPFLYLSGDAENMPRDDTIVIEPADVEVTAGWRRRGPAATERPISGTTRRCPGRRASPSSMPAALRRLAGPGETGARAVGGSIMSRSRRTRIPFARSSPGGERPPRTAVASGAWCPGHIRPSDSCSNAGSGSWTGTRTVPPIQACSTRSGSSRTRDSSRRGRSGSAAARDQPAATATGFSIGTPIRLPYSVQLPS